MTLIMNWSSAEQFYFGNIPIQILRSSETQSCDSQLPSFVIDLFLLLVNVLLSFTSPLIPPIIFYSLRGTSHATSNSHW